MLSPRARRKNARLFVPRACFCTIRDLWITRSSTRYPHTPYHPLRSECIID
jgi:hypothetical protein